MMCYSCRKYDGCELPWKCSSTMYDCSAYELEQTNEEWLRQCNTEQLAELLLRFYYQDFCMNTKRSVIEWLKQPHKENE